MKLHSKNRFTWKWKLPTFAVTILAVLVAPCAVAESTEDFHQQVSLTSGGSLTVENGRGDVSIEGCDKTEMQVDAHKIFEGDSAERDRWMSETKIHVEGDDHHRSVKVEYPSDMFHGWGGWNGRRAVNLTIHVPRQVNAELKTDRGHVTVQRIAGKLDIGSDRCDVDINRLDGELRVRATVGIAAPERLTTPPGMVVLSGGDAARSQLSVPFTVDGRVTGVLGVGAADGGVFTDDDSRRLQGVADRVAMSLERLRLSELEL